MPDTLIARVQAVLDAVDHGRFDSVDAAVDAALASAHRVGSVRAATQVHAAFSLILYRHGRLAGATQLTWKKFAVTFTADAVTTKIAFINGDPVNDTANALDAILLVPLP